MLFIREGCYLLEPSTALNTEKIIGVRGPDNLFRLTAADTTKENKNSQELAVPAMAPLVKNLTAHNTLNYSNSEKLTWFQREYPEAIKYNRTDGNDDGPSSCGACITGKAKQKPFVNSGGSLYASLNVVSSYKTGPISQADVNGKSICNYLLTQSQTTSPGWP